MVKSRYQITADYYNDKRNKAVGADLDAGSQVRGFYVDQYINSSEVNSNFFLMSNHRLTNDLALNVTLGHNVTGSNSHRLEASEAKDLLHQDFTICPTLPTFLHWLN